MTEAIDFESTVEEIDRTPVKVLLRNKSDLSHHVVMEVDFATAVEWAATLNSQYGSFSLLRGFDARGFHHLAVDATTVSIQMKPKSELAGIFEKRCRDLVREWEHRLPN